MSDWFSKCGSCCQQHEIFLNVVTHCIVQVLHATHQFLHQTVGPCWLAGCRLFYFKPCLFKASCQRKTDGADYWASWHCKILDSYGSCRYLDACSVIQVRKSEKVESVHPAVAFSVQVTHPGDLKKSSEEEW